MSKERKAKKLRMPKDIDFTEYDWAIVNADGESVSISMKLALTAKHCRKLAAWLIRAAEYLEAQRGQ